MTDRARFEPNVFVFGDLVIDHLVFGVDKSQPYHSVAGERAFDETTRVTVAGGAANCARVLSSLGSGRMCLWGLSGHSQWGPFLEVMEQCQAMDGAQRPIVYYGAHDESRYMTAIERFISLDSDGMRKREYRVDKRRMIPLAPSQALDAFSFLVEEHGKTDIHAIIINDLDMGAMSNELVSKIGEFAKKNRIPLLVDPKRDWTKYVGTEITCALPNLEEWCHIVGDSDEEHQKRWRRGLKNSGHLRRMAERTLDAMPNVQTHIIKCDKDGAVVICRNKKEGMRSATLVSAVPLPATGSPHKLGPGDVLTAALALEYARAEREMILPETVAAVQEGMVVVSAYLQIPESRMPTRSDIDARRASVSRRAGPNADVSEAAVFMPRPAVDYVRLSPLAIRSSKLVSVDPTYKAKIEEFIKYTTQDFDSGQTPSVILTGKGGVGKSEISKMLAEAVAGSGTEFWELANPSEYRNVTAAIEAIKAHWSKVGTRATRMLVMVDEAFRRAGRILFRDAGKILLQDATHDDRPVRFVFIDADLHMHLAKLDREQFLARCHVVELPELASRRNDIAYIFATLCISALKTRTRGQIRVSHTALRAVIADTIRRNLSARELHELAQQLVHRAMKDAMAGPIQISHRHLTPELQKLFLDKAEKRYTTFTWE